jgi:outer membrane receptor for Fe3+-dicitrate
MKKTISGVFCTLFFWAVAAGAQPPMSEADSLRVEWLDEIIVAAAQLHDEAPVTLQTIPADEIKRYLGAKTYPEIMRNIGGVYATSESGSYGDAKINLRGFKQENFTVLLNGVPLSGFRSGSMFWNNWLGLADATYRIQVQKGVGGSMLAANSMGGTINIVTLPAAQTGGGEASFSLTGDGLYQLRISLSTGERANGWAASFSGSRTWGEGYVDATPVDSWGYFLNLRKSFNARHALLLTLLGSPERHGQRSQKLSYEEVATRGQRYNKNWGAYNGKIYNVSENFYHKPYLSATHFFTISDRLFLTNTLYASVGAGGGKWSESTGRKITAYLNAGGQIDWPEVVADNVSNTDAVALPDGSTAGGAAKNILSDYLAGHVWAGWRAALDAQLGERLKLSSGLHYQYFYSWQNERITDLLGGAFWFEDYGKNSLAGWAGRSPVKKTGDYIRLHNGDRDQHLSLYTQLDYAADRLQAFVGLAGMTTAYRHWDRYNYPDRPYSEQVWAAGGNVKAGASVRPAPGHLLFLNGGYYSRAPYSNVYFASNTNDITSGVTNERNYIAEIGYKWTRPTVQLTVNGYYNYWQNKALMSDPYKPLDEGQVRYMISGLDAQHIGIEAQYTHRINDRLELSAFVSIGDWRWKNDVAATIYDPYTNLPVDTLQVFTDGLRVGDAPQTQAGVVASVRLLDRMELRAECRYNDRMYANFDPAKRTRAADRSQSYRIPASVTADVHVHYPLTVATLAADVFFTCNNLFNAQYIERGDDGENHDLASFRGFWNIGRTVMVGTRIAF